MSNIEFYFDFSSPYGYFASTQIDDLAARYDRQVQWWPYLVGTAMKQTGHQPLFHTPMLRDYVTNDVSRFARLLNIPFQIPEPFPVATAGACRVYYWMYQQNHALAKRLAQSLYQAYFAEGRNISDAKIVQEIAIACGADCEALSQAMETPTTKDYFRDINNQILAKGVFGSPFFIVDGEAFWGADRLYQIETWLETGGW